MPTIEAVLPAVYLGTLISRAVGLTARVWSVLFLVVVSSLCLAQSGQQVVINEILYEPADPTIQDRFVELHNPGSTPVSIAGWRIAGSITYTFPQGAVIPARGFVVVAQDPQGLRRRSGSFCLGPFEGLLGSEGKLILLDDLGTVQDQLSYKLGLPWPTATAGRSIELINPALDNASGASWRVYRYGATTVPGGYLQATPGIRNSTYLEDPPPCIESVWHSPDQPRSGQQVTISVKVSSPDGISNVTLWYQLVGPGEFIPAWLPVPLDRLLSDPCTARQPNPAFHDPCNWVQIPMADDGGPPDQADGIYTAIIPGQPNRTLIRYRITATDGSGNQVTVPYLDDDGLNLAIWVYDGVPSYVADVSSVYSAGHVYTAAQLQTVPVYFMITRSQDLAGCLACEPDGPARDVFNWECAFVYDGCVYDHVTYKSDGGSCYSKPDLKIRFHRGHGLAAKDLYGRPYSRPWQYLQIGGMFDHLAGLDGYCQGNFGLPEVVNSILWNMVGVPAAKSHWFHMRMVTGPNESVDQYHGDFWGLFLATQPYDRALLEDAGLADGNLYLAFPCDGRGPVRLHQASDCVTDGSDYTDLIIGLSEATNADQLAQLIDYQRFYWYQAVAQAVRWPQDQVVIYLQPDLGKAIYMPYQTGPSWGPAARVCIDRAFSAMTDSMQIEFRNVVREFRDLLWNPQTIGPLLDSLASMIWHISQADQDRWTNVPEWTMDAGWYDGVTGSIQQKIEDMKCFAFIGDKTWPSEDGSGYVIPGGQAAVLDQIADGPDAGFIPARPNIEYIGPDGFPVDNLVFRAGPFEDPQGPQTFDGMEWRIAEVADGDPLQARFEIAPVWLSDVIMPYTSDISIPSSGLKVSRTYRVRARMRDQTGRWSHWSLPYEFQTGPPIDDRFAKGLRITEIMYHPADNQDAEYLELMNIGSVPLDMTAVQIKGAVEFEFSNIVLQPGQYILVVKDRVAFEQVYGGGLPVAGQFTGRLDNAGEVIVVVDPFGQDTIAIGYDPTWYPQTDGKGYSLVAADPTLAPGPIWSTAEAWLPSELLGGSPGGDQIGQLPEPDTIVINEILAHSHAQASDWVELHNRGPGTVDLGGWFLSDSSSDLTKYQLPAGTLIPPGGYLVLYENIHFGNPSAPGARVPFALSEAGERLYLSSGMAGRLTGYSCTVQFGPSETGITFGRYRRSDGREDFVYLSSPTPGAANALPLVGPLVINEIMYNPPSNADAEYIELLNISNVPVKLFDAQTGLGFRFTDSPDNPGIVLEFSSSKDITIDPGQYVLLVKDMAVFSAVYGPIVPASVQVFQWSGGRLNNAGETIQLSKAIDIDGVQKGWVVVENITYSDGSHPQGSDPWPVGADGQGLSLARIDSKAYGNDPANWKAAQPSPGRPDQ